MFALLMHHLVVVACDSLPKAMDVIEPQSCGHCGAAKHACGARSLAQLWSIYYKVRNLLPVMLRSRRHTLLRRRERTKSCSGVENIRRSGSQLSEHSQHCHITNFGSLLVAAGVGRKNPQKNDRHGESSVHSSRSLAWLALRTSVMC